MRKIILLASLVLGSCRIQEDKTKEIYPVIDKIESITESQFREIRLYVIDSCEYIGYINVYQSDFLTHKGNCKFCKKHK